MTKIVEIGCYWGSQENFFVIDGKTVTTWIDDNCHGGGGGNGHMLKATYKGLCDLIEALKELERKIRPETKVQYLAKFYCDMSTMEQELFFGEVHRIQEGRNHES